MSKNLITASQSRFYAQVFNLASIVAVLIPPLLMIWVAVSIFVYASVAHHPNPKVREYNRWGGYRFYGIAGAYVPLGQPLYGLFGDWRGLVFLWGLMALIVIPWGGWALLKAGNDQWEDMEVEVAEHA